MPSSLQHMLLTLVLAFTGLPAVATERPQWSNYGPAERAISSDFFMFAEKDGDTWRVWVPPDKMQWYPGEWTQQDHDFPRRAQILDFFSGQRVEGILRLDEMGYTREEFHTADGVRHAPAAVDGSKIASPYFYRERQLRDLLFTGDLRLLPSNFEGCDTDLMVVDKLNEENNDAFWVRLILDYAPPTEECPHGRWRSSVHTVLDLHDGTFLAALESKVVRLSFADLSPVGTGATVRILDAEDVIDILSEGGDMHQLLTRALMSNN